MVTIPTGLAINVADASQRTTASGFRAVLGSLFKQSSPGVPVAGVIPGPSGTNPLLVTTRTTDMSYDVAAGYAVTTRTGQGAYLVGTLTGQNIVTAGGDAANPRYDRIYIVQPDPELSESGQARIDVVQGTPSANPSLPAIPTGALELARKLVPAGAATTSAGSALSNYATKTALNLNVQISDVAGLQAALDGKVGQGSPVPWSNVSSVPAVLASLASSGVLDNGALPARIQAAGQAATGTWDTYTSTGFYHGDNLVNSPALGSGDNFYFVQTISQGDGTWTWQNAYCYVGTFAGNAYKRVQQNGTWGAWTQYSTDSTKLVNGTHTFALSSGGNLTLDGAAFSNTAFHNGTNGKYLFAIDTTGRVFTDDQSGGGDIPIYKRNYSTDGHGSSTASTLKPTNTGGSGSLLVTIGSTGTLGSWTSRIPRDYIPFSMDGGLATVSSLSANGGYFLGTKTVTYSSSRMPEQPDSVVCSAYSSQSGEFVVASVNNPSSSGITLVIRRNTNVSTSVYWQAYAASDN